MICETVMLTWSHVQDLFSLYCVLSCGHNARCPASRTPGPDPYVCVKSHMCVFGRNVSNAVLQAAFPQRIAIGTRRARAVSFETKGGSDTIPRNNSQLCIALGG